MIVEALTDSGLGRIRFFFNRRLRSYPIGRIPFRGDGWASNKDAAAFPASSQLRLTAHPPTPVGPGVGLASDDIIRLIGRCHPLKNKDRRHCRISEVWIMSEAARAVPGPLFGQVFKRRHPFLGMTGYWSLTLAMKVFASTICTP